MSTQLRLLLDAGPAVHQRAGISRYTQRLAAALYANHPERVALRLFYNRHSGAALPPTLTHIPAYSIGLGQYAWRLSVLASRLAHLPYLPLTRHAPPFDLYHATEHLLPNVNRPTVLTVHDLIFERFPEHHTRANRLFLRLGMPLFVRAATQIIAVSRHTARDLIELYGTPAGKITVIHEGVEARFQPTPHFPIADLPGAPAANRPYLLMVGTLPRPGRARPAQGTRLSSSANHRGRAGLALCAHSCGSSALGARGGCSLCGLCRRRTTPGDLQRGRSLSHAQPI
jgi:glycosyltransferase involved in cell wall biosynthesis